MNIININQYRQQKWIKALRKKSVSVDTVEDARNFAHQVQMQSAYNIENVPIQVIDMVKDFGIELYTSDGLLEDVNGMINIGGLTKQLYGNDKVIVLRSETDWYWQRYILAYELGEYLIKCIGNWETSNGLLSASYKNNERDLLIHTFATELLMPSSLFLCSYERAVQKSEGNKQYIIAYLSHYFEVPKELVEERIG